MNLCKRVHLSVKGDKTREGDMSKENEPAVTPEFLRKQLKVMADLELSDQAAAMYELITGLVAMMNTLEPKGYAEGFPAFTFRTIKE